MERTVRIHVGNMADESQPPHAFRASLEVHNGLGGTTAIIDMRCLRVAVRGAVLGWSLPSLYRMLCGDEHMDFG